jgi:hypothetical protein
MLRRRIANKDVVKLLRTVTEGVSDIQCIILKASANFILVQLVGEFELNGYAILGVDQYDFLRHNKFDKTIKKILEAERIMPAQYGIKKQINLDSWQTIFTDLKKHYHHVIVECENLKSPTFTIGPIVEIKNKSVSVNYYNAAGVPDKKNTRVRYKNISLVTFGDRYTTIFKKYLKK